MNVEFNKKQYIIPDDLNEYLIVLDLAEKIQGNLSEAFMQKALSAQAKVVSPDEMNDAFKDAAERFIQRLCEKGVYDKTIDEYTFQNEGYIEFLNVTKNAMQAMVKFLSEQAQDYEKGRYEAEQKALSSVTGSGVSVYSSSILTLALTSAVEYTTLQGQCNKADEQYAKELKQLRERGNSERERKENGYFATQYCPEATDALRQFAYCLMGRYLDDLIANNLFDKETLQYIDLKRSQEILKNLKVSPNKEAVLEKAFIACPFNFDVYVELGKLGKLDIETMKTASVLGQDTYIKQQLYELFENASYNGNLCKDLAPVENVIASLACITGKERVDFYNEFARPIYVDVVNKYKIVQEYMYDTDSCGKLLKELGDRILTFDDTDLLLISEKAVKEIISDQEFNAITTKAGYADFLVAISTAPIKYSSKQEWDVNCTEKIHNNLVALLPKYQNEIVERERRQEQDKARKLEKAKKGKKKVVVISIALILVPFAFICLLSSIRKVEARKEIEAHLWAEITSEENHSAYWDKIGGVNGFEITNIVYYQNQFYVKSKQYIKVDVIYDIGDNFASGTNAALVINKFYSDYTGSTLRLLPGETSIRRPNGNESRIELRAGTRGNVDETALNLGYPKWMLILGVLYIIIVVVHLWSKMNYYRREERKCE